MNFVPEHQHRSDPFFDKRREEDRPIPMSDHLLFNLGQMSIDDYKK